MIVRSKKQEKRREQGLEILFKGISFLFCFFFFLCSITIHSQDSIPPIKDIDEEKQLQFQQYFFKALSEKAITNYRQAIVNLENCNALLPDEVSVLFEFSKNYYFINKTLEAKRYLGSALEKDPKNLWMLLHLVKIYKKDRNYADAIKTQQKIIENYPKRREALVYLYLQNNDIEGAVSLLENLRNEGNLSGKLKRLQQRLEEREKLITAKKVVVSTPNWIREFEEQKTFSSLKNVLQNALKEDDQENLLKYSEKGLLLFPAQPLVYLMHAKALNHKKLYKKALLVLNDGVDFVIENKMEAHFYKEMAISYEKTGNTKEAEKYKMRAKQLAVK